MMLPYLQKLKEAENTDQPAPVFQKKYIFTMIYSLALSLIAAMTLFPTIAANIPQNLAIAAFPGIFFTTILAGWGANSIINNVITMKTGGTFAASKQKPGAVTTTTTVTKTPVGTDEPLAKD